MKIMFWGVPIPPNGTSRQDLQSAKSCSLSLVRKKSTCPIAGATAALALPPLWWSGSASSFLPTSDSSATNGTKSGEKVGTKDRTRNQIQSKSVIDGSSAMTSQNLPFCFDCLSPPTLNLTFLHDLFWQISDVLLFKIYILIFFLFQNLVSCFLVTF